MIAITFDDAYAGTVDQALPELARLGLPATVFLAPAFVEGDTFWWDALAAPGLAEPEEKLRSHEIWKRAGGHGRSGEGAAGGSAGVRPGDISTGPGYDGQYGTVKVWPK